MIGTTRSRVSTFMNNSASSGFIEYNGTLEVRNSLLNVICTTILISGAKRIKSCDAFRMEQRSLARVVYETGSYLEHVRCCI
jgi:hypothetical protein